MDKQLDLPEDLESWLNTISNLTNTGMSIADKFLPDRRLQELSKMRSALSILVSHQAKFGESQRLFQIKQAELIVRQTLTQAQKMAEITAEMGNMNRTMQSIAIDLKSFTKPSVLNQIMASGALLTNNAAVVQIKRLADQAERAANSLDRIGDNMYSENSRGDKFPGHIHSYVRSMIERHQDDNTSHYFFVFNQSTTWHPKFDDIRRGDPLGPQFLGYYSDLDVLVAFIVEEARPRIGPEPIIHILVPTIGQLAITESLTFPDEMGPFCLDGQLGESGLPFVYLCFPLEKGSQKVSPYWSSSSAAPLGVSSVRWALLAYRRSMVIHASQANIFRRTLFHKPNVHWTDIVQFGGC